MTEGSGSSTGPTVTSPIVMGGEAPIVENPVAPPPEPTPETPPVAPSPAPETPVAPSPEPAPVDPVQKRINEITAKRYEEQRRADAAEAREKAALELVKQLKDQSPSPAPAPASLSEEDVERRAGEKAKQIAAAQIFNEKCNKIADNGAKEFAKDGWDKSLDNLTMIGAIGKDVPIDFLRTVSELDNPHKILHHLGKNLDQAERIIKADPVRMAMELARLETSLNAPAPASPPAPVSGAPAPVRPVTGVSTPGDLAIDDPNLPMEKFLEMRAQQREAHKNRWKR